MRGGRPLLAALACIVAVALTACGGAAAQSPTGQVTAPSPLSAVAAWGVTMTADKSLPSTISADESLLGRQVDVVNSFISWALQPSTQKAEIDALRAISSPTRTVMITWEPGTTLSSGGGGSGTGVPLLPRIAAGLEDATATTFLKQLADFPGPVVIRFAHEMNGNWYEWAGQPDIYKAAWARIHTLIAKAAPQVKMSWSVNNTDQPSDNTLESYWPGSALVEAIGLDGYNCLAGWQAPGTVFDDVYRRVAALDARVPIWITETASCEADAISPRPTTESKAQWITRLFALTTLPRVSAVVWFDRNNEFDWRINSSPAVTASLKSALTR